MFPLNYQEWPANILRSGRGSDKIYFWKTFGKKKRFWKEGESSTLNRESSSLTETHSLDQVLRKSTRPLNLWENANQDTGWDACVRPVSEGLTWCPAPDASFLLMVQVGRLSSWLRALANMSIVALAKPGICGLSQRTEIPSISNKQIEMVPTTRLVAYSFGQTWLSLLRNSYLN